MPYLLHQPDGSLLIKLYVQPRASKNEIAGLYKDALKIRLTSPPVDGKANKALIAFLAQCLNLPKTSLSIQSGHHNRNKVVHIKGCSEKNVRDLFLKTSASSLSQ